MGKLLFKLVKQALSVLIYGSLFLFPLTKVFSQQFVEWNNGNFILLTIDSLSGNYSGGTVIVTKTGIGQNILFREEATTINLNGASPNEIFATSGPHFNPPSVSLTFTFSRRVVINSFSVHDIDRGGSWNDSFTFSGVTFNNVITGGGVIANNSGVTAAQDSSIDAAEYASWFSSTQPISSFSIDYLTTGGKTHAYLGYSIQVTPLEISFTNTCFGDSTLFALEDPFNLDSVLWNFGDPNSGINNTSTDTIPVHVFTDTGSFNITLVKFLGGGSDTIIENLFIDAPIDVVNLGSDTVLCGGSLLLDPQRSDVDFLWQDTSTSETYLVQQEGQYWVQLSNSCGTVSDSINILFDLPINLGNDTIMCNGTSLVIDATTPGATSYLWQDSSSDSTFTTNIAGTYWVQVTTNNCISMDTIEVFYVNPPVINLGNDTTLLPGESIVLDATVLGGTYQWVDNSNGPTFDLNVNGNFWLTYWVSVTDINNCSASDTIIINTYSIANPCFGDSTLFTLNSTADSVLWDFGDPNSGINNSSTDRNPAHLFSDTGSYNITLLSYTGGNLDSFSMSIFIYEFPQVNLGNDTTLCFGESLILEASTPNASYLWHNGSTDSIFDLSTQGNFWGTYWVQVSENGCTSADTIIINNFVAPSVFMEEDTFLCTGDSLTLWPNIFGANSHMWQDGSTDFSFTVSEPGSYWVQATNECGNGSDTTNISFLSVNLGNDTTLCLGDMVNLDASFPGATYLWQDGSTNPTFTVSSPGIYWVQVTRSCGSVTDTIEVSYHPDVNVHLGNDTTLCPGVDLTLDASFSSATYLWQDGSTDSTLTTTGPGIYWVTVNTFCESAVDTFEIFNHVIPDIDLGNDTTLCQGEALTLDATTSNASYLWQDNSTSPTFNVSAQGSYWVQVTTECFLVTDSMDVSYYPLLALNLGNDTLLCPLETLVLDASNPGASYLWQDNSTSSTFLVNGAGIYWVEVSDNCSSLSDTINITYEDPLSVDLGNDTNLCQGETILLNVVSPNASYLWQDNSTNSSFSVLQQGTYWVQVNNNCETDTDTITVNFHSLATVNLGSDTLLCPEETISLFTSIHNADYLWQDHSSDSLFLVTEEGIYWIQVTVPACGSTSDTIIVTYDPCEVVLIMPNVFSPNGDGDNDLFIPIKMEGIDQADISIFNRWGQKIHESIGVILGWDGTTTSGNKAPTGTYFWIVNYTDTNNEKAVLKGTLTLLR